LAALPLLGRRVLVNATAQKIKVPIEGLTTSKYPSLRKCQQTGVMKNCCTEVNVEAHSTADATVVQKTGSAGSADGLYIIRGALFGYLFVQAKRYKNRNN